MAGRAANPAVSECVDRPPTPDPSPPRADARGGREEKTNSIFRQHIPSLRALAKQSMAQRAPNDGLLRRFAPRNDDGHKSAFSRRNPPEFCSARSALIRGRRECRTPGASAAARVLVGSTRVSHHGHTGNIRHSPRNGFTTYFVLSPVIGLFCHRHPRSLLRELERQRRDVRTTRLRRPLLRHSSKAHPRPPHPASRS